MVPFRALEWVAYPLSSRSSRPRNRTEVSCTGRRILYQLSYQGGPHLQPQSPKSGKSITNSMVIEVRKVVIWGRGYRYWAPGVGSGTSLQYSCLGNAMDRGAWWATVYGVKNSWTQLSDWACTRANTLARGKGVWGTQTHRAVERLHMWKQTWNLYFSLCVSLLFT